jgi:hypothetical protein
MKIDLRYINEYPFIAFHIHDIRPLELLEAYGNNGGDEKHVEAVRSLDHLYVTFRELDALENSIGCTIERIGRPQENIEDNRIEGIQNIFEAKKSVVEEKKRLVMNLNKEELTRGRESLLKIVLYLHEKGVIDISA